MIFNEAIAIYYVYIFFKPVQSFSSLASLESLLSTTQ